MIMLDYGNNHYKTFRNIDITRRRPVAAGGGGGPVAVAVQVKPPSVRWRWRCAQKYDFRPFDRPAGAGAGQSAFRTEYPHGARGHMGFPHMCGRLLAMLRMPVGAQPVASRWPVGDAVEVASRCGAQGCAADSHQGARGCRSSRNVGAGAMIFAPGRRPVEVRRPVRCNSVP